jgi:hypothetical protein
VAFLYIFLPADMPDFVKKHFRGRYYAHRGLHNIAEGVPENSLRAFALAAEKGYGVELDVHLSADGQVVVFHDDDLSRACGVERKISDCTYGEMQKLKLFGTDIAENHCSEQCTGVTGKIFFTHLIHIPADFIYLPCYPFRIPSGNICIIASRTQKNSLTAKIG